MCLKKVLEFDQNTTGERIANTATGQVVEKK